MCASMCVSGAHYHAGSVINSLRWCKKKGGLTELCQPISFHSLSLQSLLLSHSVYFWLANLLFTPSFFVVVLKIQELINRVRRNNSSDIRLKMFMFGASSSCLVIPSCVSLWCPVCPQSRRVYIQGRVPGLEPKTSERDCAFLCFLPQGCTPQLCGDMLPLSGA